MKKIIYWLCALSWSASLLGMEPVLDFVLLTSSDGQKYKVKVTTAKQSYVLKLIIEGSGLDDPISLDDINSRTLFQVIKYLKIMAKQKPLDLGQLPPADLLAIAQAADLLEIEPLRVSAVEVLNAAPQSTKKDSKKFPRGPRKQSHSLSKIFRKDNENSDNE